MKKLAQIGLILGMTLLGDNASGQVNELVSGKVKERKATQNTYLDLVLNAVGTNFNYGSFNNALADYKKSTLGAQIGVSFQGGVTSGFSLVSEVYFMMKGGSLQANNPLTISKTTVRLYTFELPVLARFHFGKLYVNAGPSIAYNFYGTRSIEGSSKALSFTNTADGFKHWDAGVQAGAGYTFHAKQSRITLDVRYNYGLTNIAHSDEIYNRSLIVSLHLSRPWKTNPLALR